MMSDTRGQIYFDEARTLASVYRLGDDPRPLQLTFARLFDEAAQTVYRAGSDLDEVLIERILIVRSINKEFEISADFLGDAELLKKSVLKHFAEDHKGGTPEQLEIHAAKIVVRHDQLRPS